MLLVSWNLAAKQLQCDANELTHGCFANEEDKKKKTDFIHDLHLAFDR